MARWLIFLGILLLALGLVFHFFPRALSWFGSLPGDLNVRRGNTRVFVPIASMLLVSVGLTLLVNLVGWLLRYFR